MGKSIIMSVKFFRVISWVEWLNGEQTNVSRTISVLLLRVVKSLYQPTKRLTKGGVLRRTPGVVPC